MKRPGARPLSASTDSVSVPTETEPTSRARAIPKPELFASLTEGEQEELRILRTESDVRMREQSLLGFALRLQARGRLEEAAIFYQGLAEQGEDGDTARSAQRCWDALQGRGAFGARMEFHVSRFVHEAADPRMILPMMAGSVIYGLARGAMLSRLAATSEAAWWSRGWGARLLSGLTGYAAEVPTFALSGRGLRRLAGDDPSREVGLGHDLASSAITLGALKLSGAAAQSLLRTTYVGSLAPTLARPLHFAVTQGSLFAGMLAAHRLEERLGLRPHLDDATTVTDILTSMLSLGVGARLGRHLLGSGFTAWESELETRLHTLDPGVAARPWVEPPLLAPPVLAMTGGDEGGRPRRRPRPVRFKLTPEELTERKQNASAKSLRSYQTSMLQALGADIRAEAAPWLSLAAPMQTGKSHLIGPILSLVREKYGEDARIFVLSSARIITDQLLQDLVGQMQEPVGRYDGLHKNLESKITVASAWALSKHLEDFSETGPVILINDEAYSTQAPTFRKIYSHFGLGEVQEQKGIPVLVPKAGKGLVIGLSGTGGGLAGYRVSQQMSLMEAIEVGAIRQMRGERLAIDLSTEEQSHPSEGAMIWWQATRENAEALVDIYAEHIHGSHPKSLVFVPTVEHGNLFLEALRRRFGDETEAFVHFKMSDENFFAALNKWKEEGGPLLSINRIGRGFRGAGTHAVFHTYQTSSPELYAQRTGRAWAKTTEDQADLFVLEVAWNRRGPFANLARLLGLIDYSGSRVHSGQVKPLLEKQRKRREQQDSLNEAIERGSVSPIFVGVPTAENWRREFQEVLKQSGGVNALAEGSGLGVDIVAGFALGALPLRRAQVSALAGGLGGPARAEALWVSSWKTVVEDILGGRLHLNDRIERELLDWQQESQNPAAEDNAHESATKLDEILKRNLKYFSSATLRGKFSAREVTAQDLQALREVDPKRNWENLSDGEWRRAWLELTASLQARQDEDSRSTLERLVQHFFRREGWEPFPKTARENLLYRVRREVALRFGGSLPIGAGMEGIPRTLFGPLRQWMNGLPVVYAGCFTPTVFYRQVRALMKGLDWGNSQINALLVPAIFEERGWKWEGTSAQERLLREARYWLAAQLGGVLPHQWDFIDGKSRDHRVKLDLEELSENSTLRYLNAWLQSGIRSEFYERDPFKQYGLLSKLLSSVGAAERKFLPLILAAVQEELELASAMDPADNLERSRIKAQEESLATTLLWLRAEYGKSLPGIHADAEFPLALPPPNPLEAMIHRLDSSRILSLLKGLTPIEAQVIRLRFGLGEEEELGLKEIGDKYNLSKERIRQLEEQALVKLARVFRSEEPGTFIPDQTFIYLAMKHEADRLGLSLPTSSLKIYSGYLIDNFKGYFSFPEKFYLALARIFIRCLSEGGKPVEEKRLSALMDAYLTEELKYPWVRDRVSQFIQWQFPLLPKLRTKRPPTLSAPLSATPPTTVVEPASPEPDLRTEPNRTVLAPAMEAMESPTSAKLEPGPWFRPFRDCQTLLDRAPLNKPNWREVREFAISLLEKVLLDQGEENLKLILLRGISETLSTHRIQERLGPRQAEQRLRALGWVFDQQANKP